MLPSPDRLVGDPLYARLKEHLVESTGMTYYADKDADLARRVGRRLSSTGAPDCSTYLDILRDPLRGARELDELIAEVTIGETHSRPHPATVADHARAQRPHTCIDPPRRRR